MSHTKLGDRIINSANNGLKQIYMKSSYFTKYLLTGNGENAKQVVSRNLKGAYDMTPGYYRLIENGVKKAHTAEEKAVMEQVVSISGPWLKDFEDKFAQIFGEKDASLFAQPMTTNVYSYLMFMTNHTENGSFVDILVVALTGFVMLQWASELQTDPKFKPNQYYDWLVGDSKAIEIRNAIKSLLDKKDVSPAEEKRLIELFRRNVVYEIVWNEDLTENDRFSNLL